MPVYRLIDGRNRLDAIERLCGQPIIQIAQHPYGRTYKFTDRVVRKLRRVMPTFDTEPVTHGLVLGTSSYDNVTPDDPAGYVISLNLKRRHLRPRDLVLHAMAVRNAAATGGRSKPIQGQERRDDDGQLRQTRPTVRVSGGRGNKGEATDIAEQTGVPARTVRRVLADTRGPSILPKPHDYGADLRAGVNKLMTVVHAVRDGKWAPDATEATLVIFLARALNEMARGTDAPPADDDIFIEIEKHLADAG